MDYVALLRGVNVGGRTIRMVDLRTCFEMMHFTGVRTILQTGNVIFRSDQGLRELQQTIESRLHQTFSYPAHVQVLTLVTLRRIVEDSPFDDVDPSTHSYVIFFENGLEQALFTEISDLDSHAELLCVGDGVLYWRVAKGRTLQSGVAKHLTKSHYRDFHTNRNIMTLRKIIA